VQISFKAPYENEAAIPDWQLRAISFDKSIPASSNIAFLSKGAFKVFVS
jgi:hypothetical protein